MSVKKLGYIRVLKLFNTKADRLFDSLFVKFMREKKSFNVKFSAKRGEPVTLEKSLPDQDTIDAFVMTFRFFIQDNEDCSFRNMNALYNAMPIPKALKKEFVTLRQKMNEYLDSEPRDIKLDLYGEKVTNRRILSVFIYGNISHANEQKKAVFDKWTEEPITFSMIELQFNTILEIVLRAIRMTKALNEKAIKELS